jgi:hypothetical protein
MTNAAYWIQHDFDDALVALLRRIAEDVQLFDSDRLNTAYLIALGCVVADCEAKTLTITDKGRDALEFYS